MVMLKKGVRYNVKPTLPHNKPAWLVEKYGGKMPALMHKDTSIVDSLAIAEYLEKTFPHTTLTRQGALSYQEVLEKSSGFFPAVRAFVVNKDASKDAALKSAVEKELDNLDEILRSTPGHYTCGIELTLADLYLTPLLFQAVVALDHFKDFEFFNLEADATRPALESFLSRMFNMEEFTNKMAYVTTDKIVNGWKIARGDAV
jgi:glutathione S-transferase